MNTAEIAASLTDFVCAQDAIIAVYLYGSHALGKAQPRSDIDVAVLFAASIPDTLRAQLELEHAMGRVPGLEQVEVVGLNHAPLRLQAEVLHTGIRICCLDDEARAAYEFDTMRRWWDIQAWHAAYNREYFTAVKENFTDGQRRAYQRARQTLAATD